MTIALGVALLGALPSLWGAFVLDDAVAIERSACVTGGFDPARIFGSNFWCEPGPLYSIQSWRPWPVLVWWGLFRLGGSPVPFHLLNVLLHLGCTWLVFDCGRKLGLDERAAGLGSIVFAGLAIHVDAVALGVGAAELWAAGFTLLALRGFIGKHWSCIAFCGLAVLSKETGVLALALLAAFDPKRWKLLVPAAAITLAVLFWRAQVLGAWTGTHIPGFVNPLADADLGTRLLSGVGIIGRYHRVAVTANPLSADYAYAAIDPAAGLDVALGVAALAIWGGFAWRAHRFLGLWMLGTCLFISNIPFVLPAMFAERLFYIPSVALALAIGWGTQSLPNVRPALVHVGLGLFVAFQTAVSGLHAWRYGDEVRIIETTVLATPRNARARVWLAKKRLDVGDHASVREHATAAAEVRPDWGVPLAYLAVADDLEGRPESAVVLFRKAMDRDPTDPEVASLFIQFLVRYGKRGHAELVYRAHSDARGTPHPDVEPP